jgi:hypothetical protein
MCTLVLKFKKYREIITRIQKVFKEKKKKKKIRNLSKNITQKKSCKKWDPLLDVLIPELFDDLQSDT